MLHVLVANLKRSRLVKGSKYYTNLCNAYLADMKLFYKRWVSKVVLVFLCGHVVSSQDVLLEHELLWILLALAHDALV